MKRILFLLMFLTSLTLAFSQPIQTFTPPTGNIDSSLVEYATATINAGGTLTITTTVTPVTNTGTTIAGIAYVEYSDGVNGWSPLKTVKLINTGSARTNIIEQDTFAYDATHLTYSWVANTYHYPYNHPGIQYRVAFKPTTTKITAIAVGIRRQ